MGTAWGRFFLQPPPNQGNPNTTIGTVIFGTLGHGVRPPTAILLLIRMGESTNNHHRYGLKLQATADDCAHTKHGDTWR